MRTRAIIFILTIFSLSVRAQDNIDTVISSQDILLTNGTVAAISKPGPVPDNLMRKRLVNAGFNLKLAVKEGSLNEYLNLFVNGEELIVNVSLADDNGSGVFNIFQNSNYDLKLSNNDYTCIIHKDFTRKLAYLYENGCDLSTITVTVNSISDVSNKTAILSHIALQADYYVSNGYDVKLNETSDVSPPINQEIAFYGGRTVGFSWEHSYPYSAYEVQVAHFPDYVKGVYSLIAIDWDNALKMIVPTEGTGIDNQISPVKKLETFRLIGGTGLYVWRVRAIGGFYEGGIGNSDNYGVWSERLSSNANIAQDKENVYWFYFEDKESNINTIRSRVYTEDLKVKEINTYADGLQNVKQTQVNIPSNRTTIVTQTEQDFTGRNSLTSIPVPLGYESDNFEDGILKNTDNEPYTAKDFDNAENGGVTPPVVEDGALSYYNNNPDKRIANTEGFPFSRTTYYNDGLNRVKEQSAPGSAFANDKDGNGHLIKYYYGTASETELVRIFGSDAPNPKNVSKTVVVDQNNVATTTYKTIEGNVIATCLNIAENETSGLLPIDSQDDNSLHSTTESVNTNIKTDYGFYSSKRIVLPQATTLFINYEISDASVKALCAEVSGDCEYLVEVNVVNLTTEEIINVVAPTTVSEENPVADDIDLEAGSYLVEKKLYSQGAGIDELELREKVTAQIQTLFDIVEFWLTKAQCNGGGESYYKCLGIMQEMAKDENLNLLYEGLVENNLLEFDFRNGTNWQAFTDLYQEDDFPKGIYSLIFYKLDEEGEMVETENISLTNPVDYVYIETGSCCDLLFPARYVPTFDFTKPAEIYPDGSVYPDFEAYAVEFMSSCFSPDSDNPEESIYHYMDGWPKGAFNLMIYHMLTDDYDRTNPVIEDEIAAQEALNPPPPTEPKYDECGNPIDESCADGECYSMRDLFLCWKGVLTMLKTDLGCSNVAIEYGMEEEDNQGFYESVNDANGDDGETQDSHYDDNFDMDGFVGWIAKRIAKRKISKRIKDRNQSPEVGSIELPEAMSTRHLIKDFLGCSGYQFAKIITDNDPLPLDSDLNSNYSYVINLNHYQRKTDGPSLQSYYSNYKVVNDYKYIPVYDFDPKKKVINEEDQIEVTDESLFPYIKNPIYAFKYFTYDNHGEEGFEALEQSTCFDDPNDCFMLDAEGHPVYDETTLIIKYIPGCATYINGVISPANSDFCHKDFSYPLLDRIEEEAEISGDDRFGRENGSYYRWVVKDFVGQGRIRCPYTHELWSSGQRYSFYQTMLGYSWNQEEATEEETFTEDCESMLPTSTIPKWYRSGNGEIIHSEIYTKIASELTPEELSSYEEIKYSDFYFPGTEIYNVNGTLTLRTGSLSRVELEMSKLVKSCLHDCSEKRSEVEKMVISVLEDSGYNIGGCISDETPENIPEEDVGIMVDNLIAKCEEQCVVSTFSCEDVGYSRQPYANKWEPGPTYSGDAYARLYLGVSSTDDAVCDLPQLAGYSDCNSGVTKTSLYFLPDQQGPEIQRVGITNIDISSLSWFEYTLIKQAKEWELNMSIEPAPGYEAEREFECTGETSTFVDKNEYERPMALPDAAKPGDTEADVKSPANTLDITITGQE
jgi:hypothetical protein